MRELLMEVAERGARYLEGIDELPVAPKEASVAGLARLDEPLPEGETDPIDVTRLLDEAGSPATVANAGGRFFGFVNGGSLPVTVAASWLSAAWDQNCGLEVASPVASRLEQIASRWVLELLGLDAECSVGFVTGATAANFTAICAARHRLLQRLGWDVESQGLFGAPPLRVVVGEEIHVSMQKALALAGLGRDRVERVPVDGQGRMRAEAMPELDDSTIVCVQAGNVNTGAFDPFEAICERARAAWAWTHVDGAFGLWARACPGRAHLAAGLEGADSWAVDCHKWLNVPYDSGLVICRDGAAIRAGMASPAPYLLERAPREPYHLTPEMSRRARGIEVWAALRSLGRAGVAELVDRCCRHAERFARILGDAGHEILNEVVINQVMVSFGPPEVNRRVIERLQAGGVCWVGGTRWQGREPMRISVSNWKTTEADVDRSAAAMLEVAHAIRARGV